MTKSEERCETCKHFAYHLLDDIGLADCYLNPPTPYFHIVEDEVFCEGFWPSVSINDRCGQYEERQHE